MDEDGNRLRGESSPYLLQHQDNPVHWWPWGAAALAAAKAADKPVLLSIGYAACHWCHVMAHESFEDPETADLMNRLFINIKVDREERPDIDHIYMSALHALGEQGGWPLTMFLTPDGAPFWGGTYFPPEPRWGRPSFRQVLMGVAEAYRTGAEPVVKNASALTRFLTSQSTPAPGQEGIGPAHLDAVAEAYLKVTDPEHGGLQGAPKFPNPPIYRFLWQNSYRSGNPAARDATHLLLDRMAHGGIYDHLGGGFARYSTDAIWLVPHFEKMLYDNAQLLELLALAYADRPNALYLRRAEETVAWMTRDMTAERIDGRAAFAASEDADSEGEEGRFYVWTETEVDALLGDAASLFKRAYDVTTGGNWEGHSILRRMTPPGTDAYEAELARARDILFHARATRIRPGRDDKVLADWNGLAIAALARAACVFQRPAWLERAREAFAFIVATMAGPDGRLHHALRLGRISASGLLDDQAAMARAALALHESTGEGAFLRVAEHLVTVAEAVFADGHGGFYTTAADAMDVPMARPRTAQDNATPAANGLMAEVLARLFHLTGEAKWRERCEAAIRAFSGDLKSVSGMPSLLGAADLLEEAACVVVAGDPDDPRARALLTAALAAPDPAVVVVRAPSTSALPPAHPAHGKAATAVGPAAYLCRRSVCGLPISDAGTLVGMLRGR